LQYSFTAAGTRNGNGDPATHIVGEADERDAVRSQQDVALAELTALPCGLVWEKALDPNQAGPLLARVHTAGHTEPQASAAL
jgi:hypothetical protein